MKGCGNIDTIGIMTGRTGMQTVAVAEKPLTGLQVIDGIVDLILHLALKENRQLNFFMPVPEKRLSFIAGKLFVAYVDRESIGSVRLNSFLLLSNCNCMKKPQYIYKVS